MLRTRRERRCRRTAEQRDELPASHSRPQGVKTTHGIVSQPSGSWNGARGMWAATNCSGLAVSALGPTTGVKTRKAQYQRMLFRFAPESRPTSRISELLPPPALRERRHRGLARRLVAVRRRVVFVIVENEPHP